MDKDLKNERDINVNRDSNSSEQEIEPTRRPSEDYEGSTGNISGEDSEISGEDSEIESEHEVTEPVQRNSFAEGSRNSRSHLEN